ncbi:ST3 beta-galactoside alpha-2,3-sialyltransferase 4 [Phyllostomus discolor]|uniref:ST3 beta-galactoside alpha-2,3-sialyltransferase 4 n=1 Tax=Phyllostomus discolor TaxID=89673 RepID=A0A834DK49_9CHIR|nr:ST3 beta-galactoside alpha-2,3-sialyltransferase 4 [Phyllostomus discolor]
MINKSPPLCVCPAGWKLLAMLALVLVITVWYSISREDSFYFPIPDKEEPCLQGEAERKAAKLFGNYSRNQPIFLQLKDYFWVKTPSAYELPYGTKGSEDMLLRVLAITSSSIPESILRLQCRRCVVVGNGHRLRNSSLGEAIDKHDMVIRLNNAPVSGYEGDVGSKTTMRLFYPESAHFNPKVENNPDTLLVLVAFKAMDFHWIESILSDKKRVRGDTGTLSEPGPPCRDVCSAVPELARGRQESGGSQGRPRLEVAWGRQAAKLCLPGRELGVEERSTVISGRGRLGRSRSGTFPGTPQKVHCVSLSSSQVLSCPVWCFCPVFTQLWLRGPSPHPPPVWRFLEVGWLGLVLYSLFLPVPPGGGALLSRPALLLWSPFPSPVQAFTSLPSP